jgi:hypothetical protein
MPYFYGVYLQNSALSTALDLLRFLAEPHDVRFSHVTLRGPYPKRLSSTWLRRQNENPRYDWVIKLTSPGNFFETGQCTVFIQVDLGSLKPLLHKPNFPRAIPHLTLYDGSDRHVAQRLFELIDGNRWAGRLEVSKLRLIQTKHRVDEVFLPSFVAFHEAFRRFVGDPVEISRLRDVPMEQRLSLAAGVLSGVLDRSMESQQRA